MKKLLGIVVLGLFLITPSQADDIRDFQIEGMKIGDSLLDFVSKEEIEKGKKLDYYKSKKFFKVEFWDVKLVEYDHFSVHIKNNDNKYKIYEIAGAIVFDDDINKCYAKQKEIIENLSLKFPNVEIQDSGRQIHKNVDNESTYDRYDFHFRSGGSVDIICYNWSDASGYTDHLAVGANSKEFTFWLENEAFK